VKGIFTNLLNPNPYLFWFAVGGPLLAVALHQGSHVLALFIIAFFASLVGTKILIAYLTILSNNGYLVLLRGVSN
jgi:threonine/homoserine/homoserine lactone efflux protein